MEIALTNLRVAAVDGGTATGKSRLVEELASLLRRKGIAVIHVSSGHLYRAAAFVALEDCRGDTARVRVMDETRVLELVRARRLEMHGGVTWLDGRPASVEGQLKAPGVGAITPHVAAMPGVRDELNAVIRRQINEFDGFVLIDGRDISHSVAPDAPLKLLLTVTPEEAARRSEEHTIEEVIARDAADSTREHGRLRGADDPGEGVVVLSTDGYTPESVRDHVYELMRAVWPELPAV